jgi:hypothetical protein
MGDLCRPGVGYNLRGRPAVQRRTLMPKYLFEAHYTPEGAKGVAKEEAPTS